MLENILHEMITFVWAFLIVFISSSVSNENTEKMD